MINNQMTAVEFMDVFGLTVSEYMLGRSISDAEFRQRYQATDIRGADPRGQVPRIEVSDLGPGSAAMAGPSPDAPINREGA